MTDIASLSKIGFNKRKGSMTIQRLLEGRREGVIGKGETKHEEGRRKSQKPLNINFTYAIILFVAMSGGERRNECFLVT